MFRYAARRLQFERSLEPSASVRASVEYGPNSATITIGARSYHIKTEASWDEPELFDFALFSLALFSASHNIEISFDQPVSKSAADGVDGLAQAMSIWMFPNFAPIRLVLSQIVDTPPPSPKNRLDELLCFSGGIDSTFAVVHELENGIQPDLLIMKGLDYALNAKNSGFDELKAKIDRQAERFGLRSYVAETAIRTIQFNWEMGHAFNLIHALGFHSATYSSGKYALDFSATQDLSTHPWGNNVQLTQFAQFPGFQIDSIGKDTKRIEKIKRIASFNEALFDDLSVCWVDTTTGANCGVCSKCVLTRLAMRCADVDEKRSFKTDSDLLDLTKKLSTKFSEGSLKLKTVFFTDVLNSLPDGELRDAVENYVNRCKRKLLVLTPSSGGLNLWGKRRVRRIGFTK
jgi:hypothetical protein